MLYDIFKIVLCATELIIVPPTTIIDCDEVPFKERNYMTEELGKLTDEYWPRDVAVSFRTGNIYVNDAGPNFHVLKKGEHTAEVIDTKHVSIFGIAMDNNIGKLYISYKDGLKTYDETTKVIANVPGVTTPLWKIFITKKTSEFYAMSHDKLEVYKFNHDLTQKENLKINILEDSTDRFVVDRKGNYFFNAKDERGLDQTQVLIKGRSKPKTFEFYIDNMAVDNRGRVFGTNHKSFYYLTEYDITPRLITKLNFTVRGMNFDNENNAVFGTYDYTINILKFDKKNCYQTQVIKTAQ